MSDAMATRMAELSSIRCPSGSACRSPSSPHWSVAEAAVFLMRPRDRLPAPVDVRREPTSARPSVERARALPRRAAVALRRAAGDRARRARVRRPAAAALGAFAPPPGRWPAPRPRRPRRRRARWRRCRVSRDRPPARERRRARHPGLGRLGAATSSGTAISAVIVAAGGALLVFAHAALRAALVDAGRRRVVAFGVITLRRPGRHRPAVQPFKPLPAGRCAPTCSTSPARPT